MEVIKIIGIALIALIIIELFLFKSAVNGLIGEFFCFLLPPRDSFALLFKFTAARVRQCTTLSLRAKPGNLAEANAAA